MSDFEKSKPGKKNGVNWMITTLSEIKINKLK